MGNNSCVADVALRSMALRVKACIPYPYFGVLNTRCSGGFSSSLLLAKKLSPLPELLD